MTQIPGSDDVYGGAKIPPRRQQADVNPENALVLHQDGAMAFRRFVMHPTALSIPDDITQQEWVDFGFVLKGLDNKISWIIGEWAEFANKQWGATYEEIAEHFGYEVTTLMNYASIVRKVPTSIRNPDLSFAHHRLVAKLPELQQEMWLSQAEKMHWNVAQMKAAMHPKSATSAGTATARKLRKRVHALTRELNELASEISVEERHEIATILARFAKKYSR